MELSWRIIRERCEGVIEGRITLADADDWARTVVQADDAGVLEFVPHFDQHKLWEAAQFLFGIDIESAPGVTVHSRQQVKEVYEQNWKSVCNTA